MDSKRTASPGSRIMVLTSSKHIIWIPHHFLLSVLYTFLCSTEGHYNVPGLHTLYSCLWAQHSYMFTHIAHSKIPLKCTISPAFFCVGKLFLTYLNF